MIDNDWYDRGTRQFVSCTSDPSVDPVVFGQGDGVERHSARWMRAPTLEGKKVVLVNNETALYSMAFLI